jgi:SNF2 family DNA or RNA helicase
MGKTSLAVEALSQLPETYPTLVLAPLSLHAWWKRNLGERPYLNISTYDGAYETFSAKVVIADESVLIKNRKSQRWRKLQQYLQRVQPAYVWLLSGNPISRMADDLWAQLHLLNPRLYRSYWDFTREHCEIQIDQWGWHVVGNKSSVDQLHTLPNVLYAASIYDLPFPDLQFHLWNISIDEDTRMVCQQAWRKLLLETRNLPNAVSALVRINQVLSDPALLELPAYKRHKVMFLRDWSKYLEPPVVVFTNYRATLERRTEVIPGRKIYLTGDTPPKERQPIIDAINQGAVDIAFFTPGVGRFGFSLPQVRNLLFWDLPLIYDHFFQAVHRVRRAGSTHQESQIHILLSDFPVEQRLWALLQRKSKFTLWDLIRDAALENPS